MRRRHDAGQAAGRLLPQQASNHLSDVPSGMLRDHALLVCGNDIDTDAAGLRADPRLSGVIGALVEDHPQPGAARADARPYFGRVLADACREHEAVEAAQGSHERTNLARGAEYEEVYGFTCVRIAAAEQRAHVARNSGNTHEAAAVVEHVRDLASV